MQRTHSTLLVHFFRSLAVIPTVDQIPKMKQIQTNSRNSHNFSSKPIKSISSIRQIPKFKNTIRWTHRFYKFYEAELKVPSLKIKVFELCRFNFFFSILRFWVFAFLSFRVFAFLSYISTLWQLTRTVSWTHRA